MDREIKFRGKRVNGGEWVFGDLWQPVRDNQKIAFILRQDNKYKVIPETVGQLTGLNDKKRTKEFPEGQPIFEGDIVHCDDFDEHRYVVSFDKGTFGYAHKCNTFERLWLDEDTGAADLEVIGNIHETPGLLE